MLISQLPAFVNADTVGSFIRINSRGSARGWLTGPGAKKIKHNATK